MCGNNDSHNHEQVKRQQNQTVTDLEETINNATVPTVGTGNPKITPGLQAKIDRERMKRTNG